MLKIFLCTILAYFSLNTFVRAAEARTRGAVSEAIVHPTKAKIVLGDNSFLELAVDYRRSFQPRWQWGLKFSFEQIRFGSGGTDYDILEFGPGIAYGFGDRRPSRRYFVEGFYLFRVTEYGSVSDDEQHIVGVFGKRFPLTKRFTYRPQVSLAIEVADSDGQTDGSTLTFDFLSLSYKF